MRIGIINDFFVAGGAEITNSYLTHALKEKADVFSITANREIPNNLDTYIISNFRNNAPEIIKTLLGQLSKNQKLIYMPKDMLPMSNEHEKIVFEMIDTANQIIFLSPLHKERFEVKYCPERNIENHSFYIPYFIESIYENISDKKKNICWVGSIYEHKGIDNVLNFAKVNNCLVDFYGAGDSLLEAQLIHSRYARFKGSSEFHPAIYSGYRYFIHLPNEIETFGRCVAEAMLCGCSIICDEKKIGFYSYGFKDRKDFIDRMNQSQIDLVKEILN